jgi:hypothetical protein
MNLYRKWSFQPSRPGAVCVIALCAPGPPCVLAVGSGLAVVLLFLSNGYFPLCSQNKESTKKVKGEWRT